MDICQHQISYIFQRAALAAALICLLAGCPGCLHPREPAPRWPKEAVLAPPPSPAAEPGHHLALSLAVAVLALTSLGVSYARRRRLAREGMTCGRSGRTLALDREDLALIRTARDALAFLLRKQMARLRVVSLAEFRRRRSPPG